MSQRVKDWWTGKSDTPPSTDPSHSVRDDLRHAGRDLAHAKDDLKADAKAKAHELGQDLRYGAHVVRDKAHDAAEDVKGGFRYAKDVTVGAAATLGDKLEHGVESLADTGRDVAEELRRKAALEKERLHREQDQISRKAAKMESKVKQAAHNAEARIKKATSTMSFANEHAPFYRDVGVAYGLSFGVPLLAVKRVAVTTPDLLGGVSRRADWHVSTVHEGPGGTDQLTSTLSWTDTLFRNTHGWYVPRQVWVKNYAALPLSNGAKAAMQTGINVAFQGRNGNSIGAVLKSTGNQWLLGYKARVPYVTLAGAVSNHGKNPDRLTVSLGGASTIFRDSARNSALHIGAQVKSGKFSPKESSMPDSIGAVSAKIEYDEPSWNVDAKVTARKYDYVASQSQGMKVSEAYVRGMWISNLGRFPRTAVGVTVGLMDGPGGVDPLSDTASDLAEPAPGQFRPYNEPDARPEHSWRRMLRARSANLAADQPMGELSVAHMVDPYNSVRVSLSSTQAVSATFSHALSSNIALQTAMHTTLPSWNVTTGGIGKPAVGIAIAINGD